MKKIITIEGNIGAGKTTFIKKLKDRHPTKFEVIFEPVDVWIEYVADGQEQEVSLLNMFYTDPKKNAFLFQVAVMVSQIETMLKQIDESDKEIIIMDRCIVSAYQVFCKSLLANGNLTIIEFEILTQLFKRFEERLLTNKYEIAKHIYLYCDPEICHERIQSRARPEEQNITIDYLRLLHCKHEEWLTDSEAHQKTLTFYVNTDMFTNPNRYDDLIEQVSDEIINHI